MLLRKESEPKEVKKLFSAGDAVLYAIGDRAYPGVVLSSRYVKRGWFGPWGWEYLILCGGLTYRVPEDDLWLHEYRHDIYELMPVKKSSPRRKTAKGASPEKPVEKEAESPETEPVIQ